MSFGSLLKAGYSALGQAISKGRQIGNSTCYRTAGWSIVVNTGGEINLIEREKRKDSIK